MYVYTVILVSNDICLNLTSRDLHYLQEDTVLKPLICLCDLPLVDLVKYSYYFT